MPTVQPVESADTRAARASFVDIAGYRRKEELKTAAYRALTTILGLLGFDYAQLRVSCFGLWLGLARKSEPLLRRWPTAYSTFELCSDTPFFSASHSSELWATFTFRPSLFANFFSICLSMPVNFSATTT